MFPTYARFFSRIGNWVVPPRRAAVDGPDQSSPTVGHMGKEMAAANPVRVPISAESAPVPLAPVLSAEETQILQI